MLFEVTLGQLHVPLVLFLHDGKVARVRLHKANWRSTRSFVADEEPGFLFVFFGVNLVTVKNVETGTPACGHAAFGSQVFKAATEFNANTGVVHALFDDSHRLAQKGMCDTAVAAAKRWHHAKHRTNAAGLVATVEHAVLSVDLFELLGGRDWQGNGVGGTWNGIAVAPVALHVDVQQGIPRNTWSVNAIALLAFKAARVVDIERNGRACHAQ